MRCQLEAAPVIGHGGQGRVLHPPGSPTVIKVSRVHGYLDLDQAARESQLKHCLTHPGIIKSTSTVVSLST